MQIVIVTDEPSLWPFEMPGVTVVATSPALQGVREAVTDGNGFYTIPVLPPGAYTVRYELQGMAQGIPDRRDTDRLCRPNRGRQQDVQKDRP